MTTMNENMHWMKLTHLLSIFLINLKAFFLSIYLYFKILNSQPKAYTREK